MKRRKLDVPLYWANNEHAEGYTHMHINSREFIVTFRQFVFLQGHRFLQLYACSFFNNSVWIGLHSVLPHLIIVLSVISQFLISDISK